VVKKKLDKSTAQEAASSAVAGDVPLPTEEIHAAMVLVKDDQVPTTQEEREKYFMSQVEKGEQLRDRGRSTR
jgi:import receptor subunit TOM20